MSDSKITSATNFDWAVNKVKLAQSIKVLQKARELNPSLPEITEAAALAEYKLHAGLVLGAPETASKKAVKPLDRWTISELADFAGSKGIDLSGVAKKGDIIAKLAENGFKEAPQE